MEKMNNISTEARKNKTPINGERCIWSWMGRTNFIKMSIPAKFIYKCNEFL